MSDISGPFAYGQLAGNRCVNRMIYSCFQYLCESDQRKFVKKFKSQAQVSYQAMHTFHELLFGAYLSARGFTVRYEHTVSARTPDWSILDGSEGNPRALVEIITFHIDKEMENNIDDQISHLGIAGYWRDANRDNLGRLWQRIDEKATAYKTVLLQKQIPYILGLFPEFEAAIDLEEVRICLFDMALFASHPQVSGVLYCKEAFGRFSFVYIRNPCALYSINVPSGPFPS